MELCFNLHFIVFKLMSVSWLKSLICMYVTYLHVTILADASLKCTFERFEKCFFDNIQEVDDFQWGLGFVSYHLK